MPCFRLFNLETLALEEFDLDDHPAYIAVSHAWIDNTFVFGPNGFYSCFGGKGIRAIVDQTYPNIRYCWLDRLCINQKDKQDKLIQIPLMGRIFGQAQAVVVFINAHIGPNQAEVNEIVDGLEGALAMCKAQAWEEEGLFWQSGEGRPRIVHAMHGLLRLASTVWATRVWTLQEYVLAKVIFWIGLDLKPIKFDDYILSALPDICNTLGIDECLGLEMEAVYGHLLGMANVRLGRIDQTRVMELLGNRNTKKPADEIYGAMAASGVIVQPVADETKFSAWRRWCEAAVTQGNIRWILLPTNGRPPDDGEVRNCVMPYFSDRHKISSSSGLDCVKPLRSVTISDGCVAISARNIGTVKIIRRLGKVHEYPHGRIHRNITLTLFAGGKWKMALQLASAFGGGRYNAEQTKAIARVLIRSHIPALAHVANRSDDDFRPCISSEFQRVVWNDFMNLQFSQMIGLNKGTGYLCRIDGGSVATRHTAVLVSGEKVVIPDLEAIDLGAKAPDGRSVLMVVSHGHESTSSAHKIGMTLPISEDIAAGWCHLPIVAVQIGGKQCYHCDKFRSEAAEQSSESLASAPANEVQIWDETRSSAMRTLQRQLAITMRANGMANPPLELIHHGKSAWLKGTRRRRTVFLKKARLHISSV